MTMRLAVLLGACLAVCYGSGHTCPVMIVNFDDSTNPFNDVIGSVDFTPVGGVSIVSGAMELNNVGGQGTPISEGAFHAGTPSTCPYQGNCPGGLTVGVRATLNFPPNPIPPDWCAALFTIGDGVLSLTPITENRLFLNAAFNDFILFCLLDNVTAAGLNGVEHHYAMTFSVTSPNDHLRSFIDGKQLTENCHRSPGLPVSLFSAQSIGSKATGVDTGTCGVDGTMDEFVVYNEALVPGKVEQFFKNKDGDFCV